MECEKCSKTLTKGKEPYYEEGKDNWLCFGCKREKPTIDNMICTYCNLFLVDCECEIQNRPKYEARLKKWVKIQRRVG